MRNPFRRKPALESSPLPPVGDAPPMEPSPPTEPEGPLREFVYLDEISVYSLYASQHGAIPEHYTARQGSEVGAGLEGTLGAGVPGLGKAEINARYSTARSGDTQIVSRSSIQATFKSLIERYDGLLRLLPEPNQVEPSELGSLNGLTAAARGGGRPPWLVDPASLQRGQLLELEVELEAEETYAVAATMAALIQIITEIPELQATIGQSTLSLAFGFSRVLERMHAGLVPLRGTVRDYRVAEIDGREWLVHNSLIAYAGLDATEPLYLVGVAEEDLFWKDIRRVVFSRSQFTVMARLGRAGLQDEWSPMKLLDVVRQSVPPIAAQLELGPRSFVSGFRAGATGTGAGTEDLRRALATYATVRAGDLTVGEEELEAAGLLDLSEVEVDGPTANLRALFGAVSEYLSDHHGVEREPLVEAIARDAALEEAGIGLFAEAASQAGVEPAESGKVVDGRILDTEFVAIYW